MTPDRSDTTIAELHRIRRELADRFHGDLFALTADAQARTEASGRKVIHRSPAAKPIANFPTAPLFLPTVAPSPPSVAGPNPGSN